MKSRARFLFCVLFASAALNGVAAGTAEDAALVPVSEDEFTGKVIGSIANLHKSLQDQKAKVNERRNLLASFPEKAIGQQDYEDAKRELEIDVRLLRELAEVSIRRLAEIHDSKEREKEPAPEEPAPQE